MATQTRLLKENEKKLKAISPSNRVLLISHCLRISGTCTAKITKEGLACRDDCPDKCAAGRLRQLAERLGYKGVCIAPGGSMALKFIKKNKPGGIVAIACMKELQEGECAVRGFADIGKGDSPVIVAVPLLKDGCVDTEVDEEEAKRVISL